MLGSLALPGGGGHGMKGAKSARDAPPRRSAIFIGKHGKSIGAVTTAGGRNIV